LAAPEHSTSSAAAIAAQFRKALKDGGSAEHAAGVQWFFRNEIKSHGWYAADLRRAAIRFRRELRKERAIDFLVERCRSAFFRIGPGRKSCRGLPSRET
jgi:hypothetical protein